MSYDWHAGATGAPPGRGLDWTPSPPANYGDPIVHRVDEDDPFAPMRGERGPMDCQSEPNHSEVSSHISRPKWRRMLRAAAQALGKQLQDANRSELGGFSDLEAAFLHPDAGGGGTEVDIHQCLRQLLEDMALSDEDTGTILIGLYHFMQADDLPVSTRTWRPLIVTALLASVDLCLGEKSEPAKEKLRRSVVHWWPQHKADHAYNVFTLRENFTSSLLTPSVRMTCYLALREQGLNMSHAGDSTTSAVFSFEASVAGSTHTRRSSRSGKPPSGRAPGGGVAGSPNSSRIEQDRSSLSYGSQEHSLMISEDSSYADVSWLGPDGRDGRLGAVGARAPGPPIQQPPLAPGRPGPPYERQQPQPPAPDWAESQIASI